MSIVIDLSNFFYSNLQTDLEEVKAHEIAKLQDSLHEAQLHVDEAKAMVIKEREAARKAIEEAPPVIKETPIIVQDTEKINALTAEIENLKVEKKTYYSYCSIIIIVKIN